MPTNTIIDTTTIPEKARRDIPRVMNRLLGQTFLYQDDERTKDDYYLVHRHRPVFAESVWRRSLFVSEQVPLVF